MALFKHIFMSVFFINIVNILHFRWVFLLKDVKYMKIHVPSMLAKGVKTSNKQTQQTNKQPQWLRKFEIQMEH